MKHTIIIGGPASGKSIELQNILKNYFMNRTIGFTGHVGFERDVSISSNADLMYFEECPLTSFLRAKKFYSQKTITVRTVYSRNYEEIPMPRLVFVIRCRRDQLPKDLPGFQIIDKNILK